MAQRVRMAEFWYLYGQTFRQMNRVSIWVPLLIQALLALVLLLMHYYIFSPVTGSIVRGWAGLINGEYAPMLFHYPNHLALLPYFYGIARLVLNAVVEAFLFGIVIDLFISLYRGEQPSLMISVRHALGKYFQLTVVWIILMALLFVINRYFNVFIEDVIGYSLETAPRRQLVAQFAARGITIVLYAFCIFLLPSIMAGGARFGEKIKRGFRVFFQHPAIAIGLVLIPYLIGLIPSWVLSDPGRIVMNFYPELVLYLILISIGIDMIANFIFLGTSLKFFMDQSD